METREPKHRRNRFSYSTNITAVTNLPRFTDTYAPNGLTFFKWQFFLATVLVVHPFSSTFQISSGENS